MNKYKIYFFIILVTAFVLRFWGIWFDLPQVYTTEEYKVLNYALKMAATKDPNPHFFNYPSLYLYFTVFVSGVYYIAGRIFGAFHNTQEFANSFILNPTPIYLLFRFLSALWSTGIVYMIYLIGKKLYNQRVAVISMIMMALIPKILVSSHEIRPSMPEVFFVLVSFYLLMKYYYEGQIRHFYYSGMSIGIATSIFYNAFPLVVLLPVVYFLHNKRVIFDKNVLLVFLLVALFFILGTPFSILDYKSFIKDVSMHSQGAFLNLKTGIPRIFTEVLFVGNWDSEIPLLGILCLTGIFNAFKEKKVEGILLVVTIGLFVMLAAMYSPPSLGYMFAAVPFFLITGARVIDRFVTVRHGYIFKILFLVCMVPSLVDCLKIDRNYTMIDNRTIAKNWIEKNIIVGSKILIDSYPCSPPIKETRRQLEELYKRAVELNHYKKDYLKLLIDMHHGEKYGYWIYRVMRKPEEVSGTIEMVKEAQKVQDLIDVGKGFYYLRRMEIQYIIVNSWDKERIMDSKDEVLKGYYKRIQSECRLLKVFIGDATGTKGPDIFVYSLNKREKVL